MSAATTTRSASCHPSPMTKNTLPLPLFTHCRHLSPLSTTSHQSSLIPNSHIHSAPTLSSPTNPTPPLNSATPSNSVLTSSRNNLGVDSKSDTEESLPPTTPSQGRVGRRMVPVHASRLGERKNEIGENVNSSLKIKIDLDLEVEVEIYARIKGDVTIGLL